MQGISSGKNRLLEAVINPLSMASTYVDQLSKGIIPPKSLMLIMVILILLKTT